MRFISRAHGLTIAAILCTAVLLTGASQATAQAGSGAQDPATLLKDFLHYVRIANPDLAEAAGNALFATNVSDEELAMIVTDHDLEEKVVVVFRRGRRMPGAGVFVAEIETRIENGRMKLARNDERVREAVAMLTGTLRERMFARKRLLEAGEYAMPALLGKIIDGKDPQLEVACTEIIEEIKRQAVMPLCAALGSVGPNAQRKICNMLGTIGYPAAIPYVLELAQAKGTTSDVQAAAMRAFKRLGGTSTSIAGQFTALSRNYFDDELSLVAWPDEDVNNIWTYDTYAGLMPTAVPTVIFSEVMSMKAAVAALGYDATSRGALALYVASDLRRENDLPNGVVDPVFGADRYSPQFFATAAGTSVAFDVLSLAIDQYDTALARDAIAALAETTGETTLFASARQPLLECLRYPSRRVQYDAALVLAGALPRKNFPGDEAVVPLLGSAVRDSSTNYGIVVASNDEDRRTYTNDLQQLGFKVLNGGVDYSAVRDEIGGAMGIDLVIVRGDLDMIRNVVHALRSDNLTAAVPIVASANIKDQSALAVEFESDRATTIWTAGGGASQFAAAVDDLLATTDSGPMSADDSEDYMFGAIEALLMLALDSNTVLNASDAEGALLQTLADDSRDAGIRLEVAAVVSALPGARAQQALIDAALAASGHDQIDLLDLAAASARRFGNNSAGRQVDALRDLIKTSTGDLADAAGRTWGALNFGPEESVQLILH